MLRLIRAHGILLRLAAEYSTAMCGVCPGTLVTWPVASSQYDILLCSETLVSDLRHVSELLVPEFGRPVLLCRGKLPRARGMAAMYEMDIEHFANQNLSVVVVKCWLLGFVV